MKRQLSQTALLAGVLILGLALLPNFAFAQDSTSDEGEFASDSSANILVHETESEKETTVEVERDEDGETTVEVERSEDEVAQTSEREVVRERERVVRDTYPQPHWMWTVGRSAIWGGMIGGLVGFGVWLVTGLEWSPWTIAQFAGGGILAGAAIGVVEATMWPEDRFLLADDPTSLEWMERDMPRTYEFHLLRYDF